MATTETLNIVITTKQQGDGVQKTETSLKGLVSAAKAFAGIALAKKAIEFTAEMTKLGAASQAAANRFEQFAGGARESAMFLEAFNEGTQNSVDRMTAMASAAKLLQMGLVVTGDDMEQIAAMATRLGDQTLGAKERIEAFSLMLANQSIPRLDNFGISSGRVRARIDELLKSGEALNREQAFKMAVMEEGAKALDTLGDTSDLASTKIEKMTAAWRDTKNATAEAIATIVDASGALDAGADSSRTYADQVYAFSNTLSGLKDGTLTWNDLLKATTISMRDGAAAGEQYLDQLLAMKVGTIDAADGQKYLSGEIERTIPEAKAFTWATNDSTVAHEQYQRALDETQIVLDRTAQATLRAQEAEEAAAAVTQKHAEYLFDASMSFTDFYRRQEADARSYAWRREDAEAEHQKQLAELAGRGRDDLIAEENARYDEELNALEESRREQEAEQKRSLGRMVLQHFNAWAEMQGLTAEETLKMQTDIAAKYGLIEDNAAQHVAGMSQNWADTLAIMRGDADGFFNAFMDRFNSLPSEKILRIRTEMAGPPADIPKGDTNPRAGSGGGGGAGGSGGGGSGGGGRQGGDVMSAGLFTRTTPTSTATLNLGGGVAPVGVSIGPVYITNSDPERIWKELERYARLKGKSGWQQLGR